jgi:hypothetical protein
MAFDWASTTSCRLGRRNPRPIILGNLKLLQSLVALWTQPPDRQPTTPPGLKDLLHLPDELDRTLTGTLGYVAGSCVYLARAQNLRHWYQGAGVQCFLFRSLVIVWYRILSNERHALLLSIGIFQVHAISFKPAVLLHPRPRSNTDKETLLALLRLHLTPFQ